MRISIPSRFAILLALSFLVAGCGRRSGPARLELLGPGEVDLGEYKAAEMKSATFKLINAGGMPLTISSVRMSCGACGVATCDDVELEPGEQALVTASLSANSMSGEFKEKLLVVSSDPDMPVRSLTIKGRAIPLVKILPEAYLYTGKLETNVVWARGFELIPTEEGVKLGAPRIESNYKLASTLKVVDGGYMLYVVLLPTGQPGTLESTISMPVLEPGGQAFLKIGIYGKIGPELAVVPGVVRLSLKESDEQPLERKFVVRALGSRFGELEAAKLQLPERSGVCCFVADGDELGTLKVTASFAPGFTEMVSTNDVALTFSYPNLASSEVICKGIKK